MSHNSPNDHELGVLNVRLALAKPRAAIARRRSWGGREAVAHHAVAAISPTGSSTRMTVPSPELFSTSTVPP